MKLGRGPKPKPPAPTKVTVKPKAAPKPPKAALKTWTSDEGYKYMRAEQLRQAEASGVRLTPFERKQVEQFKPTATQKKSLQALNSYVNNAPAYKGKVYRGMNLGDADLNSMLKSLEAGSRSNALESWTQNADLGDFTIGGKNQVLLSVENKRGVDVSRFSEYADEKEVLQPSGSRYKVKSVVKEEISESFTAKGVYRYRVELVQLDD